MGIQCDIVNAHQLHVVCTSFLFVLFLSLPPAFKMKTAADLGKILGKWICFPGFVIKSIPWGIHFKLVHFSLFEFLFALARLPRCGLCTQFFIVLKSVLSVPKY